MHQLSREGWIAVEHRPRIRQLAKAFDSVVGAEAGISDTAERSSRIDHVPAPVIDCDYTRTGFIRDSIANRAFNAEQVERER